MNISRIKIPLFIVTSILAISVIILIVATTTTNKVSKLQYYEVEGDSIPTITHVIGERKVSGKSSKVSNSVLYKRYSYYGTDSAIDDVQKYINYLSENESFTIYSQLDPNIIVGQISLGKKSLKTGKDILLTIEYEVGRYTISIEKALN